MTNQYQALNRPLVTTSITAPSPVTMRSILLMALPVMLASISTPLVGAVDLAVLGPLNDATLVGGVAAANVLLNFIYYSFNFLRTSTTGMTAQALGAGNVDEFHAVPLRACCLALGFGMVAIALQWPIGLLGLTLMGLDQHVQAAASAYFHVRVWSSPMLLLTYCFMGWLFGQGAMGRGLLLQVLLNAGNIGLSILFVWGMGWGLVGAAWATVAAETAVALVGALLLTFTLKGQFRQALAAVPEWQAIRRMIQVNGDIVIRSLTLIVVIAAFTRLGAGFGPTVLAANAILMTIFYMSGAVMDGLATATQQLSGRFHGARDRHGFLGAIRLVSIFSVLLMALYVAVLIGGKEEFVGAMAADPDVREVVERYYWWTVLTPIVGTLAFILDGVFIGASWSRDLRNMMILAALLFGLCAAVLVPALANDGLWLALMIFMSMRGILLLIRLPHHFRTDKGDQNQF